MIYLGGCHNSVRRKLLKLLYQDFPEVEYLHFGDIDVGGFDSESREGRERYQRPSVYERKRAETGTGRNRAGIKKIKKMTFATLLHFVKYTRCYPLGKYATINTKHFIFQYPYQHFKELWRCLTFLWIISRERNLNAFIPNQTAEWLLSTGYAPVKGPSASVFRIRRPYMGQTKNNGAAENLLPIETTNPRFLLCSLETGKGC